MLICLALRPAKDEEGQYWEWALCSQDSPQTTRWPPPRGPESSGPARQTYAKPFAIVIGTQGDDFTAHEKLTYMAVYLATQHFAAQGTLVSVMNDSMWLARWGRVGDSTHRDHGPNSILLGGPHLNGVVAQLAEEGLLPVHFDRDRGTLLGGFSIGPCHFSKPSTGVVFTAPTGRATSDQASDGMHLVVAGTSIDGISQVVEYTFSSNQPLSRPPFSNMFPDFLVAGPNFRSAGYGGVQALGHWDHRWQWTAQAAYMRCSVARKRQTRECKDA